MKPPKRYQRSVVFLIAACFFAATASLRAQAASGTIEGRVSNPVNGSYLENARISVDGVGLETFSDAAGFYRLTNVPAGTANVRAFFTGMEVHTAAVTVAAGQSARHDVALSVQRIGPTTGNETVKLARYVVAESQQIC
jgi:iron complex outermembrane receptor protein